MWQLSRTEIGYILGSLHGSVFDFLSRFLKYKNKHNSETILNINSGYFYKHFIMINLIIWYITTLKIILICEANRNNNCYDYYIVYFLL